MVIKYNIDFRAIKRHYRRDNYGLTRMEQEAARRRLRRGLDILKLRVYNSSDKWDCIPKDYSYYFIGQLDLNQVGEFIKDLNERIIEREAKSKDNIEEEEVQLKYIGGMFYKQATWFRHINILTPFFFITNTTLIPYREQLI